MSERPLSVEEAFRPDRGESSQETIKTGGFCQFALGGGVYRPTPTTVSVLPAGVYKVEDDHRGLYFYPEEHTIPELIMMPNSSM